MDMSIKPLSHTRQQQIKKSSKLTFTGLIPLSGLIHFVSQPASSLKKINSLIPLMLIEFLMVLCYLPVNTHCFSSFPVLQTDVVAQNTRGWIFFFCCFYLKRFCKSFFKSICRGQLKAI